MKIKFVAFVVALALLASGCQKAAQSAINAALAKEGIKIDTDGKSGTITTPEGSMSFNAGDGAKVPESFPSEIPMYPGAKLASTMSLPTGVTVALEASDDLAKVSGFYKAAMAKNGWKQEMEVNGEGSAMLTFSLDKKALQLTASASDGKTTIVLMFVPPEL